TDIVWSVSRNPAKITHFPASGRERYPLTAISHGQILRIRYLKVPSKMHHPTGTSIWSAASFFPPRGNPCRREQSFMVKRSGIRLLSTWILAAALLSAVGARAGEPEATPNAPVPATPPSVIAEQPPSTQLPWALMLRAVVGVALDSLLR